MFDKAKDEFKYKEAHLLERIKNMKDELDSRPYQRNFNQQEDLEKEIEDLFLKEEKDR